MSYLNYSLKHMSAKERLQWICKHHGKQMLATTSGGKTSAIIPELLRRAFGEKYPTMKIPILFIDTLCYPRETYDQIEILRNEGHNIITYFPSVSLQEVDRLYPAWRSQTGNDFEKAKILLKHEPLNRAFAELRPSVWISGLMQYKSDQRKSYEFFEIKNGLPTLRPILDWNEEKVAEFMRVNNLTENNGHIDIMKGADQSCECGIHQYCGIYK